MPSTYSDLKIQLMATGENSGTWGSVTNVNLGTAIEEAIVGSANVAFSNADVTLTLADTNATQTARNLRLNLTGTVASPQSLIVPAIEKVYIVNNGLTQTITVKNSTGTGTAVPAGKTMWVYNNATNVVDVITHLTSLTLGSPLAIADGGTGSTTATFSGANITSLNASNISSGTLANARTTASDANGASTIVARDASGNFSANVITANGSAITAINANNISTGTLANARTTAASANGASTIVARDASGNFSANIITADGSAITAINANNISTGTIANARTTASSANSASTIVLRDSSGNFTANIISANGSSLTAINASNISTGTLSNSLTTASSSNGASTIVARDASGNFSANIITASGSAITSINASNISTGTLANARTTASDANGASTIVARDASGSFSANQISDAAGNVRDIPINTQTTSYTLVSGDIGKFVSTNSNVTVPNAVFAAGDVVSVYNSTGSNITVVQGGAVTLRQAGTANTGNRTLQQYGVATVLCTAANNFVITGSGLA